MDSPHIKLTIYPDTEFGIQPDIGYEKNRISSRSIPETGAGSVSSRLQQPPGFDRPRGLILHLRSKMREFKDKY